MTDYKSGQTIGATTAKLQTAISSYDKHIVNTLALLSPRSGASLDYCQGVLNGVVTGLMAGGLTFREAIFGVVEVLPVDFRFGGIVPAWIDPIADEFERGTGRYKHLKDSQGVGFNLRKYHMLWIAREASGNA